MIDIKLLRDQSELVKEKIRTKNTDPVLVEEFLSIDREWRSLTSEIDALRSEQKKLSVTRNVEAAKLNKESIRERESRLSELETERNEIWMKIPNLPSDDSPVGKDDSANEVLREWGEPRSFDFKPLDHVELGEKLGIINTEKAAEISGARFAYLMGGAARLEFAIVQWVMETLADENVLKEIAEKVKPGYSTKPFVPVLTPMMVRSDIMRKMARLEPRDERYHLEEDDLYLIGSAEHALGPLHMDEALAEDQLPIRYLGFSSSFRREAGSYGKDTRGILRLHQFDKLEMESFSTKEDGLCEQNFFVAVQEYLVQKLKIPYRIVICSTGDQGDPDTRHLDLEIWMPGQNKYRETHSADYMSDYQSRRLGTRVKRSDGSVELAHMNDATAFAIGRTLIAIMENYQTEDGQIEIPEVLKKYVKETYLK